jgi:uncharacterized membrane protein YqjE
MTGNGRYHGKTPNVAASVSDLTHDVIELSELQAQLFALDARQSMQKAKACLVLAVVGACLLLGTIPVALLTIAALLVEQLEWSYAAGAAAATFIGLLITGIVLGVAWTYVRKGLVSIDRSRDELRRNVAWLKSTLRTRGQAASPSEQPINF